MKKVRAGEINWIPAAKQVRVKMEGKGNNNAGALGDLGWAEGLGTDPPRLTVKRSSFCQSSVDVWRELGKVH